MSAGLSPKFSGELFEAWRKAAILESDLYTEAMALVGESDDHDIIEDITFDDYDSSVEIYCYPGHEIAPLAGLYALGFRIVWAHSHVRAERMRDGSLCRCPVLAKPKEIQP